MAAQPEFDEYIHDDASHFVQEMKDAWTEVTRGLEKPNVLLAGSTGAGKSSLVNAVFGFNVAAVGAGVPITQHFQTYEPADKPVVLYDAKGLEHGEHEGFIAATKEFFATHNATGDPKQAVHMVWYVINSATARFQPFEEKLCREVFIDLPIVFILNKADLATPEDRRQLRAVIEDMRLPNCLGVYDTVADLSAAKLEDIDICPACGSNDLGTNLKRKRWECDACGQSGVLDQTVSGLDAVVEKTLEALPEFAKDAFVSAQLVSFQLKDSSAHQIIKQHYKETATIRRSKTLMKSVALMLTKLSILWDFREHGPLYCTIVAREVIGSFTVRDKFMLFLTHNKTYRLETTAMGVLWTRCLRKLATILLNDFIGGGKDVAKLDEEWDALVSWSFSDLNEDQLNSLIDRIEQHGIEQTLQAELNAYGEIARQAIAFVKTL